jgi:Novel STAND NTPase 1
MRHSYDHGALLVHAASGAGKSSVVRAGVYPKLNLSADWIVAPLFKTSSRPSDTILRSLSHSLLCINMDEDKVAALIKEIDSSIQENSDTRSIAYRGYSAKEPCSSLSTIWIGIACPRPHKQIDYSRYCAAP